MTESKKEALDIELISGTHSFNLKDVCEVSSSTIKTSWQEMTLMDAQEKVNIPRSMARINRYSGKIPN